MDNKDRPEVPKDKIIKVNNCKKIDFEKPFTFIYFNWWFEILSFFPFLLCYVICLFVSQYFSFHVVGRKNMRILRKQGCITISNHCHYFDTILTNYVLWPRHLYTSVVQRNFEVPKIRYLLRILRAFPIPSKNGLEMIAPTVKEVVRRKRHIHILPEGNLVHRGQTIHRFRSGAFVLSCLHQIPIVPIVFVLHKRTLFGKQMNPPWIKITMVVGEPIFSPKLQSDGTVPHDKIEQIMNQTATWMDETIIAYHPDDVQYTPGSTRNIE